MSNLVLPKTPLLSDGECRRLIMEAQKGHKQAQDKLVESNLRLVWNVANRFYGRGYEMEDLFQIGCIGLIKSINKFNCNFDVKFSTYAVPVIIGEIRQFLRDDGLVKVSRTCKETGHQIQNFREEYIKENGCEPTTVEIAKKFQIDTAEVAFMLEANKPAVSLYEVISEGEGDPVYLIDQVSEEEKDYEIIDEMAVRNILDKMPERFQLLIKLRFFEGKTQTQVAETFGVSQVQVCRLERAALSQIGELLKK